MSIELLVLGYVVILIAAFIMSLTGFGFALIAAPLLLFFIAPKSVVVINIILAGVICLLILKQSWSTVKVRSVALMLFGSIFGIPFGAYILSNVPSLVVKIVISVAVVFLAILLALGHSHKFRKEKTASVSFGMISGVLASSTSLAGPPVILFLLNQRWGRKTFRASLAFYFLLSGLVALLFLALQGIFTTYLFTKALLFAPILPVGFYLGTKAANYVDTTLFRKIAILIIISAGLLGIVTTLPTLL